MGVLFQSGRYLGKVVNQQIGESSAKKTPQFVIAFSILGAINPSDPDGNLLACPNGDRSVYLYLTEKTAPRFWKTIDSICEKAGIAAQPEKPSDLMTVDFDFADAEIELECKHEAYNDELQERWDIAYNGSDGVKPLETSEVARLDALFGRGKPKPAEKPAPRSKPTPKRETVPASEDKEDVPF